MNLFRALKDRSFALLWGGQTTSRLGDSLFRISLSWWVLEKTGSAAAMGTVLVFSTIPMLVFLLIGGVITDRFSRLKVMLFSDIASGAVVLFITIFSALGLLEVWHIYIASLLFGIVEAFFQPAYTATIPEITPQEYLTSANSLTNLSARGASIFGPALGAGIVALGGTSLAFGLDSLSFFISAMCIAFINRGRLQQSPAADDKVEVLPSNDQQPHGFRSAFIDFKEGFRAVASSAWLWVTILLFGFVNATSSPTAVSMPILVKMNLHSDVGTLGLFTSSSSIGFVLGSVVMGNFRKLHKRGILAYLATLAFGGMISIFGLTDKIPILVAASFMNGVFLSIFGLIWVNTLQELVPQHLLGRVASIDALGSFVLLPIGYAVSGWATDLMGAPQVFVIGGLSTAALALIGLMVPAVRNLD